MTVPVLTIDGPGGAGKGTVGQRLALECDWHYLDSGALYRVVGWLVEERGYAVDDIPVLVDAVRAMSIECRPKEDANCDVFVDGVDVSSAIRREDVGDLASKLAPIRSIREALVAVQSRARRAPGLVADGRDMGTVVFKDAMLKVYLHAELEIRVMRRYKQLKGKDLDASLSALREAMRVRDERDLSRDLSPLSVAPDALVVDTSNRDIDSIVAEIRSVLRDRLQTLS